MRPSTSILNILILLFAERKLTACYCHHHPSIACSEQLHQYDLLKTMTDLTVDSYYYTCDDLTPDLCNDLQVYESQVEIHGINVTYWIYYSPSSAAPDAATSLKNPIIAIHGGPSFPHNYMLPLKQQACRGRPIIFYDQAGCGKSNIFMANATTTESSDIPSWLLDPLYYATIELPTLIDHLHDHEQTYVNFQNGFHIIGNSWGTLLSQLYFLKTNKGHSNVNNYLLWCYLDHFQIAKHIYKHNGMQLMGILEHYHHLCNNVFIH